MNYQAFEEFLHMRICFPIFCAPRFCLWLKRDECHSLQLSACQSNNCSRKTKGVFRTWISIWFRHRWMTLVPSQIVSFAHWWYCLPSFGQLNRLSTPQKTSEPLFPSNRWCWTCVSRRPSFLKIWELHLHCSSIDRTSTWSLLWCDSNGQNHSKLYFAMTIFEILWLFGLLDSLIILRQIFCYEHLALSKFFHHISWFVTSFFL